jgi:hypothetical protein
MQDNCGVRENHIFMYDLLYADVRVFVFIQDLI